MRLLSMFKSDALSADDSLKMLHHFGGMLDHVVKVVTTIALLTGLEVFRQTYPSTIVSSMYWLLWFFLFLYLQRLYTHCITFLVENRTSYNVASDPARWAIGLSGLVFTVALLVWGDAALNDLVKTGFLQTGDCS